MDTIQGKEWGIASSPLIILSPALLGLGGTAGFPHSWPTDTLNKYVKIASCDFILGTLKNNKCLHKIDFIQYVLVNISCLLTNKCSAYIFICILINTVSNILHIKVHILLDGHKIWKNLTFFKITCLFVCFKGLADGMPYFRSFCQFLLSLYMGAAKNLVAILKWLWSNCDTLYL